MLAELATSNQSYVHESRCSSRVAKLKTLSTSEASQGVGEQVAGLLRGFAGPNDRARALGIPTIGVSHGTVFGCLSEHGVPMAGFDHEFTTGSLFAAHAQAFLLGHIHRHQGWCREDSGGQQAIAYAGSIGRFHFGEEGDKGFLVWNVEADAASYRLEPTPARRTIDIAFEGRPDVAQLRQLLAQHALLGASVRVRWTVADEDRGSVDRAAIEALLVEAAEVKLEGRTVPIARTRAAGVSRMASLVDKVRAWSRVADVSPDPMLHCLRALEIDGPEAIVERTLCEGQQHEVGGGSAEPIVGSVRAT